MRLWPCLISITIIKDFGFLVDVPEIRALIDETRRLTPRSPTPGARRGAAAGFRRSCSPPTTGCRRNTASPISRAAWAAASANTRCIAPKTDRSACSRWSFPPGSQTPIHDHLAWGLIGVYRGVQDETVYRRTDDGRDESKATLEIARQQTVKHGEFYTLLPPLDDIHYVKTVSDTPSISIHLLANDTACVTRHRFDAASGIVTPFRSGYSQRKMR